MRDLRKYGLCSILSICALMTCFTYEAHSQFNVQIGYSLGFVSPEINNQILAKYDASRTTLFDDYAPAGELKFMYGLALGARYRFGIGSLGINWESMSRTLASTGIIRPGGIVNSSSNTKEIKYSLNMLMLTYESNFGIIGVGSSIGRNLVSIREAVPGTSDKFKFLQRPGENNNRSINFARFHVSFNFTGNGTVAFAIKPFIQIPLSEISLEPLSRGLEVQAEDSGESFPMFGLSFSFYNGRQ